MSDKFGVRPNKYLFVAYPKEDHRYYFYNSVDQKMIVSKHAIILKKKILVSKEAMGVR